MEASVKEISGFFLLGGVFFFFFGRAGVEREMRGEDYGEEKLQLII